MPRPTTSAPSAWPMNSMNAKLEVAAPRASGSISVARVCSTPCTMK